jgi:hypothetical protein
MSKEGSSFGKRLSRFIIVISAVGLGLSLWSRGIMNEKSFTALLILSVIAAALDSVWVKLIFAIAGIGFLLLSLSNYEMSVFIESATYIGLLIFILFGFYVMIGGMSRK